VRLRRHAQTGDPVALAEAGAALEGVRATAGWTTDGSVCHGAAGLAEVLLAAHAALGTPEHLADARALGGSLAARARAEGAWACGIPGGGETPALMTGLAGIGLTLLRLHDPASAPSPALPPALPAY
jgi:lantibiotic modifying enzyme